MNLHHFLLLATTLLAVALASAVLPACGDDGDDLDARQAAFCAEACGNDCFVVLSSRGCLCTDDPACRPWFSDGPAVTPFGGP